ncbi:conserved hypothetical protein [Ricinus communis]|uniref:Retrotransposon Copia-like N-terminal domain-containing protein n=1 Tax=Ricinus communis TaxID=3988 RepID=B9SD82_RICCO|nr:conserved hypothetical protein [Ricinus communis]
MTDKGSNDSNLSKQVVVASSSASESDVNTSQKLTSILLNEFNYLPWSREVTIALGGRSRLGFINSKEKAPAIESSEYETWLSKDQMVMPWILNSMERGITEIFSYSESALYLWETVRECTREEVRRKVLSRETTNNSSEAHAYLSHQSLKSKAYKGKRPNLKCDYCNSLGHTIDRCWSLHPKMKPKALKDKKGGNSKQATNYKAHVATHKIDSFSSDPTALLKDFASYLQEKHG